MIVGWNNFAVWLTNHATVVSAVVAALAGIAVAAFTFVLAKVTRKLASLTKDSADIAKDSLIVGNGAFVFVPDIIWQWHSPPDNLLGDIASYAFRPVWQNSGNTQTKNMKTMVAFELLEAPIPDDFDFTKLQTPPQPALIGPKSSIRGGSVRDFTVEELEDVAAGRKFLYFWGWCTYQDVFPNTAIHLTRYCLQVRAGGDLRSRPVQGKPGPFINYLMHPRGNCSDSECSEQGLA